MFVGFEYGLNFSVFKSSVTSRKLTTFLFASIVILRSFLANILHISFFTLSISLGVKNIPDSINRRLSDISSDEHVFNEAAAPYQEALRKSGYTYSLKFKPSQQTPPNQTSRRRNIIWFNPPFSKNVKTNIGRAFISLIHRCFPTGHKLRKIFNRNTIKLSYSCMPNVKQI